MNNPPNPKSNKQNTLASENGYNPIQDKPYLYKGILDYEHNPELPTVICLIGPAGAGKDTVLELLVEKGILSHVKTATTRKRRWKFLIDETDPEYEEVVKERIQSELNAIIDPAEYAERYNELVGEGIIEEAEPEDSYIWMRGKKPEETDDEYREALIKEYGLLEHDNHSGNFYGLPKESINPEGTTNAIPTIRNEINGATSLLERLKNKYNVLVIAIIPDNIEQIGSAVKQRSEITQKELEQRLMEAKTDLARYNEETHYIVHNTREKVNDTSGLQNTLTLLEELLEELINNN